MKKEKINNGFCDYYYLFQDGKLYNEQTNRYLTATNHQYELKTVDGQWKKASLKALYKSAFNKVFCIDTIADLKGQIWKQIPLTEGNYFVSNKGRVKSYCSYKAKLLSPTFNKGGYARVDIWYQNTRRTKLVSRLVAQAFLETPQDIDSYQLHHKDFNKKNNSIENLIWLNKKQHHNLHNRINKQNKEKELCKQQKTKK